MKIVQKPAGRRFVKAVALFVLLACCFSIIGYIVSVTLCVSGEEVYVIHTNDERPVPEPAQPQEKKGVRVRFMSAGPTWDIDVWTNDDGRMDRCIYIALIVMFALYAVVGIAAEVCLILIFANLYKGRFFIKQNISCLLYYGLLKLADAFVLPLINHIIVYIANMYSGGRVIFSSGGQGIINKLLPCIVYIVAAYIMHYGYQLQDEVDHTL